jgi:hypothetical protein
MENSFSCTAQHLGGVYIFGSLDRIGSDPIYLFGDHVHVLRTESDGMERGTAQHGIRSAQHIRLAIPGYRLQAKVTKTFVFDIWKLELGLDGLDWSSLYPSLAASSVWTVSRREMKKCLGKQTCNLYLRHTLA